MLLATAIALIMLATAVFLLGVLGYWNAATLLRMKTLLARLGTPVTSLYRRFRPTRTPAPVEHCDCLACHAFQGVEISIKSKHKMLPRLAEQFADDLATEIEDYLGTQRSAERD